MNVASLQKVAQALADPKQTSSILRLIVDELAHEKNVALVRVWLVNNGGQCTLCPQGGHLNSEHECLHLVASSGDQGNSLPHEQNGSLFDRNQSQFSTPGTLINKEVIAAGPVVEYYDQADGRSDWTAGIEVEVRAKIRGFAGQSLIYEGELLGVLGLFSKTRISGDELSWLRTFADSAAIAIATARTAESKQQAEDDLRLQVEVLKNIPVTAWTVTPDGQLDFVNRFYLEIMGGNLEDYTTPLEVWNKSGSDLPPFLQNLHPDHRERVRVKFWESIRSGKGWTFEALFLHATDGKYHWQIDRAVPVRDLEGRVVRFVGSCADIDDLKRADEQARSALAQVTALKAQLEEENTYLIEEIHRTHNFSEIIGSSPPLLKLLGNVEAAAPTDSNVLISGETGSGKELIARAVHSRSRRKARPLVKVNCGAIPADLVESELFGHVKGAFTGALNARVGRFELADSGTLFLDEVGELPIATQVKLLRVLQEQQFEPVGSSRTISVDVRIIAATNRDLESSIAAGQFRSDLFYRLNVIPLRVPPLRDRLQDIPEMVMYFLENAAKRVGRSFQGVSDETMRRLVTYPWPGNVRELQNVIERGVVLSKRTVLKLGPDLLPEDQDENIQEAAGYTSLSLDTASLAEVERDHILRILDSTGWRISGSAGASSILKLHPNTLRSRMKKLGIERSGHGISSKGQSA